MGKSMLNWSSVGSSVVSAVLALNLGSSASVGDMAFPIKAPPVVQDPPRQYRHDLRFRHRGLAVLRGPRLRANST